MIVKQVSGKFGAWRSPVAYLYGVQVVEGSNPFAPTNLQWSYLIKNCEIDLI